ncbi:MAG: xylosidase [Lentisphaerae bacterium RIFOXYA12_FULL_48_11]|nr:MAG: xylosidase [Lentisphaerae bacterium RIFOXYA12_FULL_48_11]
MELVALVWLGMFSFYISSNAAVNSGSPIVSRHGAGSQYLSYEGLVMCGYQGWFRAEGDGAGRGWVHYCSGGRFDPVHLTVDLWPDVSEYQKTYPTTLKNKDGSFARLFSSWDESTVELHFKWMQDYGVDGVFMQRFFGVTRSDKSRKEGHVILGHALKAAKKYGRALAVMYDLSGLKAAGEDCSSIIQDWKELVDEIKLTSQGNNQTYLYHRGRPLVAIWGLGFSDRPYKISEIGFDKLIDFLKNDPVYGGCSIMLGVPAQFRDLKGDCVADPYLHEILARVDVVMPWVVGRYSSNADQDISRYGVHVKADVVWCTGRQLDYAACVFPGFSWYNLMRQQAGRESPLNQIPRKQGKFYWDLIGAAIGSGAKMLYVAMFDEIDEGTAIFKCANELPVVESPVHLLGYEGVPNDHYLWLTGNAGQVLRGKSSFVKDLYLRLNHDVKSQ